MSQEIRVLTIDAGGVRGLLPALLLADMEKQLGSPILQHFDLICGTGTGAVLATGLTVPSRTGRPLTAAKLLKVFEKPKRGLYQRSALKHFSSYLRGAEALYAGTGLARWSQHHYKDVMLSEANPNLLVPCYDLEQRRPFLFKSWKAQGQLLAKGETVRDRDYRVTDLIAASMAEPGLQDPKVLGSKSGKRATLIHGGLYASNPAMCALVSAHRRYPEAENFQLVSLGTGREAKEYSFVKARFWEPAQWHKRMLNLSLDGAQGAVEYQINQVLADQDHYRFSPILDLKKTLRGPDDSRAPVIQALRNAAQSVIDTDPAYGRMLRLLSQKSAS